MTEFKKVYLTSVANTHSTIPPTPTDKNTYKTTFKGQTKNREKTKQKNILRLIHYTLLKEYSMVCFGGKIKSRTTKKIAQIEQLAHTNDFF